jgi:hypothetical protein
MQLDLGQLVLEFTDVELRSQSLADPPLRYRAPLGAKSRTEYDTSVAISHCRAFVTRC